MKTILTLIVSIAFGLTIYAQSATGIYLTANDYLNHKLSYEVSKENKVEIKLHKDFYKPYIQIITGNSTIKLSKDSVFGYRDSKQNDYRFNAADERVYRITENKTKVIYMAFIPVMNSKGNGRQLVPTYFYSVSLTSPILPLTNNNK